MIWHFRYNQQNRLHFTFGILNESEETHNIRVFTVLSYFNLAPGIVFVS